MRRIIDLVIAVTALPFLIPVYLIVSLGIVLESPGAPFYRGQRVGKDGRTFLMWKFRTMMRGADRVGGAITTPRDPRITKVGQFLRKSKLDELPQFINLLAGDITLIGPRPEHPSFVAKYTDKQKEILEVKPGITGPAQLHFTALEAEIVPDSKDADQFYVDHVLDQKIALDLEYVKQRTFVSDLRVLLGSFSLVTHALTHFGSSGAQANQ